MRLDYSNRNFYRLGAQVEDANALILQVARRRAPLLDDLRVINRCTNQEVADTYVHSYSDAFGV